MEVEMDKMIKEEEHNTNRETQPLDDIPLIVLVLATTSSSSVLATQTIDASEKLVRVVEEMTIRDMEIESLKTHLQIL